MYKFTSKRSAIMLILGVMIPVQMAGAFGGGDNSQSQLPMSGGGGMDLSDSNVGTSAGAIDIIGQLGNAGAMGIIGSDSNGGGMGIQGDDDGGMGIVGDNDSNAGSMDIIDGDDDSNGGSMDIIDDDNDAGALSIRDRDDNDDDGAMRIRDGGNDLCAMKYPYDVDGHWSEIYVRRLYDLCIVKGYADGTFRPDQLITRAEMVKMALYSMGIDPIDNCGGLSCGSSFPDLDSWQGQWVARAQQLGIVEGYPDGRFRPNQPITRAEATKVVLATYGVGPISIAESFFDDVEGWSLGWIESARIKGIVHGIGNGNFDPNRAITRGESAKIVALMMEWWDTKISPDGQLTIRSSYSNNRYNDGSMAIIRY